MSSYLDRPSVSMLAVAASLALVLPAPAEAATPVAYLGTDFEATAPFDIYTKWGETSGLDGDWDGTHGSGTGVGGVEATAYNIFPSSETWGFGNVKLGQTIELRSRCLKQTPQLRANVVFDVSYLGTLNTQTGVLAKGDASFRILLSPDGDKDAKEAFAERVYHYQFRGVAGRQRLFDDIIGAANDRIEPYIVFEAHAHSTAALAYADFLDYSLYFGEDGYTTLHGITVDWQDGSAPTLLVYPPTADHEANGWYSSPATIRVSANDPESCVHVVAAFDNGGLADESYPGPDEEDSVFNFEETGEHRVDIIASNWQDEHRQATPQIILVDGTRPTTTPEVRCDRDPQDRCIGDATINLMCTDEHSGCDLTFHRVDGGLEQPGSRLVVSERGVHTVDYWSTDKVWNTEQRKSLTVEIVCRDLSGVGHDTGGAACAEAPSVSPVEGALSGCGGRWFDDHLPSCTFVSPGDPVRLVVYGSTLRPYYSPEHGLGGQGEVWIEDEDGSRIIGCPFGGVHQPCRKSTLQNAYGNGRVFRCRVWGVAPPGTASSGAFACFASVAPVP